MGTGRKGAVVAAAVAAGVAGCGGGDDGKPTARIKSVSSVPGQLPKHAPGGGKPGGKGEAHQRSHASTVKLRPRNAREKALRRAARRIPPSRRSRLARLVGGAVLNRFGFRAAKVVPTANGTGVRVVMRRAEACTATSTTEDNLISAFQTAIPWLDTAAVVVAPGNEALSAYVRAFCPPIRLPSGSGPVLLTQSGSGVATTRPFSVGSSRFTVEYLNGARFLQIVPVKDGRPAGRALSAVRRGPGRYVLSGGPGRFSLQIASVGEWTIRVRGGG